MEAHFPLGALLVPFFYRLEDRPVRDLADILHDREAELVRLARLGQPRQAVFRAEAVDGGLFGDGLDMSSAVRLFLKQVVIRRRVPFDVIAEDPFWSDANQRVLAESIRSLEEGKGEQHELIEA